MQTSFYSVKPQFAARYNANPNRQAKVNVASGLATLVGGGATVGSAIVDMAHGAPSLWMNLLTGGFNMWAGNNTIQNNGGINKLKDPG